MVTDGERPHGRAHRVDGHTFWQGTSAGSAIELVTETGIELDGTRCRWTVRAPGGGAGIPVESGAPQVRHFMDGVLGAMQRATRKATVRPAPKPTPKRARPLPVGAPVPCPLCMGETPPSGGGGPGGVPWPDCELCDGAGAVTQRRAEEWHELHGR